MRTAYWDSNDPEMYFDNPNLRWGSPSYLLEPGDPGYVPPANSATETKQKAKKMKQMKFVHSNIHLYGSRHGVVEYVQGRSVNHVWSGTNPVWKDWDEKIAELEKHLDKLSGIALAREPAATNAPMTKITKP